MVSVTPPELRVPGLSGTARPWDFADWQLNASQGLSADLADGARPNNVLGGIPTIALDYSPAWDAQLFTWTPEAIDRGFRGQVREEFQILTFVQDGLITGPGGKPFGSSGFSINCPIVQRLD